MLASKHEYTRFFENDMRYINSRFTYLLLLTYTSLSTIIDEVNQRRARLVLGWVTRYTI